MSLTSFIPSTLLHQEDFIVRTYEIDSHKLMTPPAILNLMHEAAMQNVLKLKVSVWDLEPHQISWVLMRMDLKVKRFPRLGEKIKVCTYPSGFEKFFTYRDYLVYDESGEKIAYSSSTWVLMDTVARKLRRIPPFILDFEMPPAKNCLPRIRHKLPAFGEVNQSVEFEVHWYDLDFNQHLNNVSFIKWLLQTVDDPLLTAGSLSELDIMYRSECRWKDRVRSELCQLDSDHFLHRLVNVADGRELALAQTKWHLDDHG